MADLVQTIEIYQGVDFQSAWGFYNPDPSGNGDPINLVPRNFTNYNFRMMVRLAPNATSPLILSFTSSPSAGLLGVIIPIVPGPPTPTAVNGVQLTISRAQSLVTASTYPNQQQFYYDLLADNLGSSTTELLMQGAFIIAPTVTR